MKRSEASIRKSITKFLRSLPGSNWVPYIPGAFGTPGTPDIIGCLYGHCVLIEIKNSKGGELSKLQKYRHREWQAAGGTVLIASDIKQFKENILCLQKNFQPKE